MVRGASTWDALRRLARAAMEGASAPFSRYRVGAALEAEDGTVYTGCNVESASFGLTTCAERVALLKAVSEGARRFRRMAVVADGPALPIPCGACRQLLWEYAPDLEVWVQGEPSPRGIAELLPAGFRFDPARKQPFDGASAEC